MRKLTFEDAEWIRAIKKNTRVTVRVLAKEYKVSPSTIENIVNNKVYIVPVVPPPPPRPSRKFTAQQVLQMRQLHEVKGLGATAISRLMGQSATTVREVIHYRTYKDVA